ncbi:MAG: EF-hand domain-containing protein [Paracoccaceae bacterium]
MIDMTKITGASLVALAIALTAGAAFADRMGGMGGASMAGMDFAAMDADGDGKVTQAEIEAHRAARTAAIDTDGDGLLSADELAAMHIRAATERANMQATRMIGQMDADGDGKLSAAELTTRPMPARMFERLDTDKDGAISEAEMAAAKDRMTDRRGARGEMGSEKGGEKRGGKHRGEHGSHGKN